MQTFTFTRRSLVASALAAVPYASFAGSKRVPVGLELFSVREELKKDRSATLDAVAKMGYQCVEFFAPYYDWSVEDATQVRKQLDKLGMKCYSTHNGPVSFSPEGIDKAVKLNKALGSRYIVMASAGKVTSVDDWKRVAETLNTANSKMKSAGLHAGYHNHDAEWKPVDGQKPIEILAANTDKSIMLQLDVGTCVETGNDPVAWINQNPGRIRSLHLKEWSPQGGYRVLFGQGVCPWKEIFAAAESKGGVEYYLVEQEGSQYPELETADRCLIAYRDMRGYKDAGK